MSTKTPMTSPIIWEINYRGAAKNEAENLKEQFELAGAPIARPRELPQADAKLGAEEIIITIVASAALKAVVQVAFQKLQTYLVSRISERKKASNEAPNLQVVVKANANDTGKRQLLSLKTATLQTIDKFIGNLSEAAAKAIDSSIGS